MVAILQVQKTPCIRAWKQAMILSQQGHQVYLGQMVDSLKRHYTLPTDCYTEIFNLTSVVGLSMIVPYFNILHIHNEPDWWPSFALSVTKGTGIPVIYDCHDWIPGRQNVEIEYLANSFVANTLSDLTIYVSEIQREIVKRHVGENIAENILIHNYPLKSCIPKETLPKIRKGSDPITLVYAGGVSDKQGSHRYFVEEFKNFLRAGFELYCYAPQVPAPSVYAALDRGYRNFHWMGHCKYTEMIKEISQYDIGLLPFQKLAHNAEHLDSGLPNKLFEYISAGLPVACKAGLENQEKFIVKNQVGIMYSDIDDFKTKIFKAVGLPVERFKWIMDDEVIEILIPYYKRLGKHRDYIKAEPKQLMTYKDYAMDCEIFEGHGMEIGLYGKGHEKDLAFESYMAEERKLVNEEFKEEEVVEIGNPTGEEDSGAIEGTEES